MPLILTPLAIEAKQKVEKELFQSNLCLCEGEGFGHA